MGENPQASRRACLSCRKRTARFATYGFAVHGPTCHLFYRWLDAAVVGTGCALNPKTLHASVRNFNCTLFAIRWSSTCTEVRLVSCGNCVQNKASADEGGNRPAAVYASWYFALLWHAGDS